MKWVWLLALLPALAWADVRQQLAETEQDLLRLDPVSQAQHWQQQLEQLLQLSGQVHGQDSAAYRDALRLNIAAHAQCSDDNAAGLRSLVERLVLLLLENPTPAALDEVQQHWETLKRAEIRDYLQQDCLAPALNLAQQRPAGRAVLYPLLLGDQARLLLLLPEGIQHFRLPISPARLGRLTRRLRRSIQRQRSDYPRYARALHAALIEPLLPALTAAGSRELVLIPDGKLHGLPFAALQNAAGQTLIERYQLSISPGLQLTAASQAPTRRARLLAAGPGDAVPDSWPALPGAAEELQQLHRRYPGRLLHNAAFTSAALDRALAQRDYRILHLATHAEVAPAAGDSFLLTADGPLPLNRLADLLEPLRYGRQPLDLLTLSACRSAAGSPDDALGFAGVALQAGVSSALASLWAVDDAATLALMTRFYTALQQRGSSRSAALQQAQLTLLQGAHPHPFHWAAFQLIGNPD